MEQTNPISNFVKYNRLRLHLTQEELAEKAGVGLRFIRDMEQGKVTLRMDKVNQVLSLFGHQLQPASEKIIDPYEINRQHFNRAIKIELKNKTILHGIIIEQIMQNNQITGWRFIPNKNAHAYKKSGDPGMMTAINHTDILHIENQD